MAGVNVTFKEVFLKYCVVNAREALYYYPILFHGRQNEFMEIIKDQYTSDFEKMLPAGRAMPEIDDEILVHIVSKLYPVLACNASVPWYILQRVVRDNAESPAGTNLVSGRDIERFLEKNGLVKAHSAQNVKVSLGTIFVRKELEKKKYDLNRLKSKVNLIIQTMADIKRVELNPHMTLKFAIDHGHAQWDWERFGANAKFTWADFEAFAHAHPDIFALLPNRSMQKLARGYLAKNCNLTVDEFRKIKPLSCLSNDLLMRCIARNPFVWHPALYKRRISAAREDRRSRLCEFMREIIPLGIAVAVLRYCDCI